MSEQLVSSHSNVKVVIDPGFPGSVVTDLRTLQGLRPLSMDQTAPERSSEAAQLITQAVKPPVNAPAVAASVSFSDVVQAPARPTSLEAVVALVKSEALIAPSVKVSFEITIDEVTSYSMEAWFHQVIRDKAALVFVSDTRVTGFPRAFPNITPRPIHVNSSVFNGRTLVCQTTGLSFDFLLYHLEIMLVTDELVEDGQ